MDNMTRKEIDHDIRKENDVHWEEQERRWKIEDLKAAIRERLKK